MTRLRASGAARQAELSRWPALVLTAGLATRLQPLSSLRAKAALPVAGEALVVRILRRLAAAGIRRVVLNLHHRPDSITRIVGDGSRLNLSVRYSWESEVLGSAGGPARAIPLLEADRFFIVNGDMITDVDVRALADRHVDTNALVTMAVIDGLPGYNGVIADDRGCVKRFGQAPGAFHFVGVQAVNASVFAGLSPDARSETVHGIYPPLVATRAESVRVFRSGAEYFDIGSPRDYLDTAITIAAREGKPLDQGIACSIAGGAVVSRSILWDRVTVGAGARLTECVATDGVIVPPGANYSQCSLVMRDNELVAQPWNVA